MPSWCASTGADEKDREVQSAHQRVRLAQHPLRSAGDGMERVTDAAAAVLVTVESLLSVLDGARLAHAPAVSPAQLRVLTIVARGRQTNMSRLAEALGVVPSSA